MTISPDQIVSAGSLFVSLVALGFSFKFAYDADRSSHEIAAHSRNIRDELHFLRDLLKRHDNEANEVIHQTFHALVDNTISNSKHLPTEYSKTNIEKKEIAELIDRSTQQILQHLAHNGPSPNQLNIQRLEDTVKTIVTTTLKIDTELRENSARTMILDYLRKTVQQKGCLLAIDIIQETSTLYSQNEITTELERMKREGLILFQGDSINSGEIEITLVKTKC